MTRPLFDPDKLEPRDPGRKARREKKRYGAFEQKPPLSIGQPTDLIRTVLADRTPSPLRVIGEISNFSDRNHWYLTLKDESAVLSAVMWAAAAARCDFIPEHGQRVVATGRLDFYGPQGRLQLYIDHLEPAGQGELEQQFRQLCDEFRKLGYFDDARKKPMPVFPKHLAIITSAKGAALQDVIRTARQRWPGIALTVIDVRVQGAAAAPEIARALKAVDAMAGERHFDAVILTRGGGSLEDLWAFNERRVAETILKCRIPIAAAIGHETDTTIAELVADLRCSTPTQAAARLVPDIEAEQHRLAQYEIRLKHGLMRAMKYAQTRLHAAIQHPVFRQPDRAIQLRQRELHHMARRLREAVRGRRMGDAHRLGQAATRLERLAPHQRLTAAQQQLANTQRRIVTALRSRLLQTSTTLEGVTQRLQALDPRGVLSRGYSYTTLENGRLLKSITQGKAGQVLHTHLSDGKLISMVHSASQRLKKKSSKRDSDDQPKLFDTL